MHWRTRPKLQVGDSRAVKRFAFLPVKIDYDHVWLETYYVFQKLRGGYFGRYWRNKSFIDKTQYEERYEKFQKEYIK